MTETAQNSNEPDSEVPSEELNAPDENAEGVTLDEMELNSSGETYLAADTQSATSKGKQKHSKPADKRPRQAVIARLLFGLLLFLLIGYSATILRLYSLADGNPHEIITSAFDQRGGYDTFIVGDQLLTPDQRIENLGIIRQRSTERNFSDAMEFLKALGENNPPDVYRALIDPTIDPMLVEKTSVGNLPRISKDGRSSLLVYARPFNEQNKNPEISIVVHGLGISNSLAKAALRLRPEVSLAFSPYATNLKELMLSARKSGHETLLEVPMEPSDYPLNDPGPFALRKHYSTEKNIAQLEWILSRAEGYVGLINFQGDALLQNHLFTGTILPLISRHGLMFVEKGDHGDAIKDALNRQNSYHTKLDIDITFDDDEISLQEKLDRALIIAEEKGRVTIGVQPFPMVLMRLAIWINNLQPERFHLTPISSRAQLFEAQSLGLQG